uniref:Uncharacterized protein n=1 Tax=Arundo donax TaxID=35708 RepID=A0A0A8ZIB6_ARUDO
MTTTTCAVWKFSVSTAERKEVSSMEVSTPFLSGRTIGCMETNVVAPMSRLQWYIEDSGVTREKLGKFSIWKQFDYDKPEQLLPESQGQTRHQDDKPKQRLDS